MPQEVVIPRDTVNDSSVVVVALQVNHGAKVAAGDQIAEVETSKANLAIEATSDGYIEWLCFEGEEVDRIACVARIHEEECEVPERAAPGARAAGSSSAQAQAESIDVLRRDDGGALPSRGNQGWPLFSESANYFQNHRTVSEGFQPSGRRPAHGRPPEKVVTPPSLVEKGLVTTIRCDLYRYLGSTTFKSFLLALWYEPGFLVTLIYRLGVAAQRNRLSRIFLFPLWSMLQRIAIIVFGIAIPFEARIGPGLYFPHWGGIWINRGVTIGTNVTIGHDVSIGTAGPDPTGHPTIGDRAYVSTGARLTGDIEIGSDVLITANALVTDTVADGAIMIGIPARQTGQQESNRFARNIHPDSV